LNRKCVFIIEDHEYIDVISAAFFLLLFILIFTNI